MRKLKGGVVKLRRGWWFSHRGDDGLKSGS